jgi:hypothetical protein
VHGDVSGASGLRGTLADWLDYIGLISCGGQSQIDRYIGYFEPYATSHDALDDDKAMIEETRNVARAISNAIYALREGRLFVADKDIKPPRQK